MILRSILRTLSILALLLAVWGSSPSPNLFGRLHGGGDKPIPGKSDPKPPISPDSTKSGFAKLVVKNLGPVVNSRYKDFAPTITADGRTMFFVSERPQTSVGKQDFWMTVSPENNDTT